MTWGKGVCLSEPPVPSVKWELSQLLPHRVVARNRGQAATRSAACLVRHPRSGSLGSEADFLTS